MKRVKILLLAITLSFTSVLKANATIKMEETCDIGTSGSCKVNIIGELGMGCIPADTYKSDGYVKIMLGFEEVYFVPTPTQYHVLDGENELVCLNPINATFDLKTVKSKIKPGINKLEVYISYANDSKESRALVSEFYAYNSDDAQKTDEETNLKIISSGLPDGAKYTVEKVTEKSILDKILLNNKTVYKVSLSLDDKTFNEAIKDSHTKPTNTNIKINVPIPKSIMALSDYSATVNKYANVFTEEGSLVTPSKNGDTAPANFFQITNDQLKNLTSDGYVYIVFGEPLSNEEKEDSNNTVNQNDNSDSNQSSLSENNNNIVENPNTGSISPISTVIILLAALGLINYKKRKLI